MTVKNIVFDVGNVLVKWAPDEITAKAFPGEPSPENLSQRIFKSPIWYDLNLGRLSEVESIKLYNQQLGISIGELEKMMDIVKDSLTPVEGSFELLEEVYRLGIPLYSITDNIKEIVSFLRTKYNFFDKFIGVVVSADIGILKPSEKIYQHLLDQYQLVPGHTVFIDDLFANVEGARRVGMQGIRFSDAAACRDELKRLGVVGL
jgi:putative hydrolase of the HAD superfamily